MKPATALIAVVFLFSLAPAIAATPAETASVQQFLGEFCTKCHGKEKQKGDIRLDDLTSDMANEASRWAVVRDQIRDGEMPPKKEKQPTAAQKLALTKWISIQMGSIAGRKPSLGNLVPHELLFGPAQAGAAAKPPEPRLWRLGPDEYMSWVRDLGRGKVNGIVQPFTASPERGIKDFAALAFVDGPGTGILIRNANAVVEKQAAHEIVDGKVKSKNDAVREFTDLMDPALTPSREQLEKAVARQFQMAIARKPEAGETARFVALYEKCAKDGDRQGAVKTMLAAVLLRSDAVFRSELGGPGGMLTPREAASAISSALMHRRENHLFEAAEKGELATREQVAGHIRRILDDPKIEKPKVLGFFREYFGYDSATDVFKDKPADKIKHTPHVLVSDTDRLVSHILQADQNVFRELLTTRLSFVNYSTKVDKTKPGRPSIGVRSDVVNPPDKNAKRAPEWLFGPEAVYGFQEWPAEQPAQLPEGTRIGVLMQPSWLVAWSENFNNDIVRRGRFIRERLLGGTVPDLPIGVAAMVPDETHGTLRDRVGSVTKAEACWKCHRHMDDLALPFEQFDHYGRLTALEQILDPAATEANVDQKGKPLGKVFRGVPVVTSGLIAGTGDPKLDGPVKDARELITRIANSDRARQVFIRHVFRYYLGRNESLADAATLQAADKAYVGSGGSFKALLVSLLTSDSFLHRAKSTTTAQLQNR